MILEPLLVPGQPANLSQLMDYVAWAAAAFGLDDAATYRLSLAVDEIATNIVLHGYEDAGLSGDLLIWAETDLGAETELEAETRPAADPHADTLSIFLEDTGAPFDPRQAPQPTDLDRPLEERRDGGLGIFLALWGVDGFVYEREGNKNRCLFQMRRRKPAAGDGALPDGLF